MSGYDHKHYYHNKPDYYKLWVEGDKVEEGGKLYFKIKIDDKADRDIKIHYATKDGTAKAGEDYKGEYGVAVIKKGTDYVKVDVQTIEDHKHEATENMFLKVWEHDKYVDTKKDVAEGVIKDDDAKPVVKVSIKDASAKEGEKLYFKIELDRKASEDITVYYKTEDGTAKAWHDYKPEYGKVTIKEGDKYAYIDVKSIEDKKVEGNEFFKVKISENEKYAKIDDGWAYGKIIDDDYYKPYPHHGKGDYDWH